VSVTFSSYLLQEISVPETVRVVALIEAPHGAWRRRGQQRSATLELHPFDGGRADGNLVAVL